MAFAAIKKYGGYALVALGAALWLAALFLLAKTAQNSAQFGRLHPWILLINALGVVVLLVLLTAKLAQLVRDYRRHVIGSRLKLRTVTIFGALVIPPLLIVYYFALEFLNRGIDSWFDVEVKQGLNQALMLSRAVLDHNRREYLDTTETLAQDLELTPERDIIRRLDTERRANGALEMTLLGQHGRIIATSTERPTEGIPQRPSEEAMLQVRQGRPFVSLEPESGGGYIIRTAVPLAPASPGDEPRALLAVFPVPERLGALADTVQRAHTQYGELSYLREPLKYSFRLTLTLVLLLSLLAAVYGAFFSAQRLVKPIQDLAAGTRAVGKGDFDTRLPLSSRDEMGFLVHSFNDMTKRLARARAEARSSQQAVEAERANLAIILARLSTGVVSLEPDMKIRTANQAASNILGFDLESATGKTLAEIAGGERLLTQFVQALQAKFAAGQTDWREQLDLRGESGRVLMCACTTLPGGEGEPGGHVVVFDDITVMLQAQRDAAWGEVARRLAHEIKNPLTPIQLSAERMQRRFLGSMMEQDARVLERATHTIVQQVEAMKQMVNAFSEYARAPEMTLATFDLNQLVQEVVDLYRAQDSNVQLKLDLDRELPSLEADRGRVRQILNNLITNSMEALEGREGAEIDIATHRESTPAGPLVQISVADNGPGFAPDIIGQAFDPYVTSKPKGTGLGLAIVKKIVEEHGGRIEAENRRSGGARVRVTLPADERARVGVLPRDARKGEMRRERA